MTLKDIILFIFSMSVLLVVIWPRQCRDEEGTEAENANCDQDPTNTSEPSRTIVPAPHKGWDSEQKKHHRKENIYWFFSASGSIVAAGAAGYAAFLAIGALKASQEAARAAKAQTEISNKTLIAANRPWLRQIVSVIDPITITDKAITFSFAAKFHNFGKSPASHITYAAILRRQGREWFREHDEQCEFARLDGINKEYAPTIFPEETGDTVFVTPFDQAISDVTMNAATRAGPIAVIAPLVLGCVVYKIPYDGTVHRTWFALTINGKSGTISAAPQTIAVGDLVVSPSSFGKNTAD